MRFFSNEKKLWKKYEPMLLSINSLEDSFSTLSDIELREKTFQLKKQFQKSQILNDAIISTGFALTKEAAKRTLGLQHYNTQLLGGLILLDSKIAEMKTGEGKTLVATAPAFVNGLTKKGVHIVTVNDYLAKRDSEWMGQIYRYLDLSVGLIQGDMENSSRKKNYARDITYVTNGELGFDFLRDNMAITYEQRVQRPFYFAIVDEIDSILIDEARTPLIISGESEVQIAKYVKADEAAKYLEKKIHFEVDEKAKSISLTKEGFEFTKKLINVANLYDLKDPWIPYILNALKAKSLFLQNIHYIVKNKEIIIVDEFTGRIMEGRKWSDGLHQAIEIKEGIANLKGTKTLASITYQNFFRLYPKLSGMTGTAKTEELEFEKIYNLSVVTLPTFKPLKRKDLPDLIYIDEIQKWKAVAEECIKMYTIGRPVLVGTTTIQNSEILSQLLIDYNIPHQLLNAKPENIKRESEIIAQAGCLKAITIATNMAGRGTDILLGGNAEFKARQETENLLKAILNDETLNLDKNLGGIFQNLKKEKTLVLKLKNHFDTLFNIINVPKQKFNHFEQLISNLYKFLLEKAKLECLQEAKKVKDLGGLYVIGTERHESRRIDNQLRGRSGRQGDPGGSRFFLSLNDSLLRIFGGDRIKLMMQTFQLKDEALESRFLSNSLNSAQQKVEGYYYDQRKNLHKYDKVLETQRQFIYKLRREILLSSNFRDLILEFGEAFLDDLIQYIQVNYQTKEKLFLPQQILLLLNQLNLSINTVSITPFEIEDLRNLLYRQLWCVYDSKELEFGAYDVFLYQQYQKLMLLKNIDYYWSKHLENMQFLKEAVTWEAYAQKDPFLKYEERAQQVLNLTLKNFRDSTLFDIFAAEIL